METMFKAAAYTDAVNTEYESCSVCGNGLQDRNIIVIGASSNIGQACTKQFLTEKVKNIACIDEIEKDNSGDLSNKNVKKYNFDFKNIANIQKHLKQIEDQMGISEVALICIENTKEDSNIDMHTVWFLCQQLTKYWKRKKNKGHITIVAQEKKVKGKKVFEKGIAAIVQGAAYQFATDGILINGVITSEVYTEEIAALIAFMSSHYGEMLTGTVIDTTENM